MVGFSRTKWVGVERPAADTYMAHGILEDDLYGMELDVQVQAPQFVITGIQGRLRRFTTSECPKAQEALPEAIGLRLRAEDFVTQVNRKIGRQGCRHLANLLIECSDAILRCALYGGWPEADRSEPSGRPEEHLERRSEEMPFLRGSCYVLRGVGGSP